MHIIKQIKFKLAAENNWSKQRVKTNLEFYFRKKL